MNLSVSVFPDSAENIGESGDLEFRKNPVNEEHDGQAGNDEIISQDDAKVQVMRHISSLLRGDNSRKDFHELNQKVIYIEGARLNEIWEDCHLCVMFLHIFFGKRWFSRGMRFGYIEKVGLNQ
jgi:hypothetical protein